MTDQSFQLTHSSCLLEPVKLKMSFVHQPDSLSIALEFDTQRYRLDDIQRLADSFVVLLQSAVAAPDAPVGSLDFVPAAERERLLVEWNSTENVYRDRKAIH